MDVGARNLAAGSYLMLHGGEGDVSSGEVSRRPGRYRSECCRAARDAPLGATLPPCPTCGQPAEWTWTGPLEAGSRASG